MTRGFERLLEGLRGVFVVIDDEHAPRCEGRRRAGARRLRIRSGLRGVGARDAHRELAAEARACALCRNGAAMQLHQATNDREPEPEPAFAAIEPLSALREDVENPGKHERLDADARVANREDDVDALPLA